MATINKSRLNEIPDPENSLELVTIRMNPDRVLLSENRIASPDDAAHLLSEEMRHFDREHFIVVNLQSDGRPINAHVASIGNLDSAPIHPREIFKTSILSNAASVLLLHNHPSGNIKPSPEDFDVTRRLVAAGNLLGIKVLDHIVVGHGNYYSFQQEGDLDNIRDQVRFGGFQAHEAEAEYAAEKPERKSFRERVAETFIQSIKEDPKEWVKKWASNETEPAFNMASKTRYKGANAFILKYIEKTEGYNDPRWMTFLQAKDAGYRVPRGTKATPVEYYFMYDRQTRKSIGWSEYNALSDEEKNEVIEIRNRGSENDPNARGMRVARYQLRVREHYVFNASQLEGVPEYEIERVSNDISPSAVVDAVAAGMGVEIEEIEQGRAFYSPANDKITMPLRTQFASDYDYQSTALHELGHATGHATRLNRDQANWFGTPEYAYEELVAEITSCFMGEYLDTPMSAENMDNHTAYIQSWIGAIEKDSSYLFRAIKEAEKAADYMVEAGELENMREVAVDTERNTDAYDIFTTEKSVVAEEQLAYIDEKTRLRNEIESVLEGSLYSRESLMLCEHTPEILQKVGLEDKPILFTQRHLRDGLHEKGNNPKWHGLSIDDYLNLEQNMSDPAFVIDSFSDDDSVLVVTSTVDKEKNPIMACIRANGTGQYLLTTIGSNYLTSVYGRENFINFFEKNLEADYVLYAGKEKTQELERISELPLFRDYSSHLEFDKIIHKSNNIVNEDMYTLDEILFELAEHVEKVMKGEKEMAEQEKNGNKLYISLNKAFCRQTDDKFVEGKLFNIMTMPKGTMLNGKDIGGHTISPLYMSESQHNPNNMVATYYLKENEATEIKLTAKDGSYSKVDVVSLKEAIDSQQKLYREQQQERQKEKEQTKTKTVSKTKEKGEELE